MIGSNVPVTEPAAAPMDPKKKQMAMMLMAQQLQRAGQPMQAAPTQPRQQLDIYGQPIQGA